MAVLEYTLLNPPEMAIIFKILKTWNNRKAMAKETNRYKYT